jgi:hypothetical protein
MVAEVQTETNEGDAETEQATVAPPAKQAPVKPAAPAQQSAPSDVYGETVYELLAEKIPESTRQSVMDAIKDKPLATRIDFVKTFVKLGVNLQPAKPAGQVPLGSQASTEFSCVNYSNAARAKK